VKKIFISETGIDNGGHVFLSDQIINLCREHQKHHLYCYNSKLQIILTSVLRRKDFSQ